MMLLKCLCHLAATKMLDLLWSTAARGVGSLGLWIVHRDLWVAVSWLWWHSSDPFSFSTWKKSWCLLLLRIPLFQQVNSLGRVPERWLQLSCPQSSWPPGSACRTTKWWKHSVSCCPYIWTALPASPASFALQTSPGEKWAWVSLILNIPKFQRKHINFSQELHHSCSIPRKYWGGWRKASTYWYLQSPSWISSLLFTMLLGW